MQGLALADCLAAFCTYGLEPLFMLFYDEIGHSDRKDVVDGNKSNIFIEETGSLVSLEFPYCLMHFLLSNLADMFHLVSILLTASLGLQKFLAVACPIWSKLNMSRRKSAVISIVCFLFSISITMPRMFVVSMNRGQDNTCLVSNPHEIVEKYVLAFHPIIYAGVMAIAIGVMIVSTFVIVYTLCRRKIIRGHATVSKSEGRSCILIICVMMVFLLSEVPRIYINSVIFKTFRSDLDRKNIAEYKVKRQLEPNMIACFGNIFDETKQDTIVMFNITEDDTCTDDRQLQPNFTVTDFMRLLKKTLSNLLPQLYTDLKTKPILSRNSHNINMISDKFNSFLRYSIDFLTNRHLNFVRLFICRENPTKIFLWYMKEYAVRQANQDEKCSHQFGASIDSYLPFLILGGTPYSEPMNYILNIIWGNVDMSLEHLKWLMEILKLTMVAGCASNFVIYIIMSKGIRGAIAELIMCWKRKKRGSDIEMHRR